MIRFLEFALLLLSVFVTTGCGGKPGTATGTSAPIQEATALPTPAQPYDQLIYLNGTEVKEWLGEPSTVETRFKQAFWRYDELKLRVSLFEDTVYRVDVQAGLITEGLAVGDDEAFVQVLTKKVKSGSPGVKTYIVERESHWYRIVTKEHKIVQAMVEMPAYP